MTRATLALTLAASLAAGMAAPAAAQAIGLRGAVKSAHLTNEDVELMRAASAALYTAETPEVGAETIWQNPDTGAHGTVELAAFDGRCAEMRHLFAARGQRPEAFMSRRCLSDDGRWLLSFEEE